MLLENRKKNQVIIVGGGLAGLVSALHLSKKGIQVVLIEKNSYPKHKVCGEYISNEVLPYLNSLAIDPIAMGAKQIDKFVLSTVNNKVLETQLPLGGFGISRYSLDHELAQKAITSGVTVLKDSVIDIQFRKDEFIVQTKSNGTYYSKIVLGAYGKRANLDVKLQRNFIKEASPYLAVKAHYKGDFPDDVVAIHNFKGGYCGVSRVENDAINVCYIADYKSFKKYKNITDFQEQVVFKNAYLKNIFSSSEMIFPVPLSISQISFSIKKPVEQHILMCGDTAGMIHPLCGNGMGMAIHGGKLVSELVLKYFNGELSSRKELEKQYTKQWNANFLQRVKIGKVLAALYRMNGVSQFIISFVRYFPNMLSKIITKTHGKPLMATKF